MTPRRQNVFSVVAFIAVVFGILLLSPGNRERVQNGFLSLISPFLKKGSEWDNSVAKLRHKLKSLQELEIDNDRLKVENDKLKALNQALQGVERENLRLKEAFGYKDQSPFSLVPARIIGRSEANWWSTITIDRGIADGVMKDLSAITPDGLVGKVISSSQTSAIVLLISDETCGVAATLTTPDGVRQNGIIRIRGDRVPNSRQMQQPRMTMSFLPRRLKLEPGSKVYTSGLGKVFPENIIVGEILESKERELDTEVIIQPAVNIAALTDVFIVVGMKGALDK